MIERQGTNALILDKDTLWARFRHPPPLTAELGIPWSQVRGARMLDVQGHLDKDRSAFGARSGWADRLDPSGAAIWWESPEPRKAFCKYAEPPGNRSRLPTARLAAAEYVAGRLARSLGLGDLSPRLPRSIWK